MIIKVKSCLIEILFSLPPRFCLTWVLLKILTTGDKNNPNKTSYGRQELKLKT